MLRVCLFFSVLTLLNAVSFKYSTIITSADVTVGTPMELAGTQSDNAYRIYATYASGGSDDYAKNVFIYDKTGATYTVYGLSQAKPGSSYILDNLRILRAPIYIHDKNVGTAVTPYTVYAVDSSITMFPVVNARLAPTGEVDSNNGFIAAGLTVLSAEPYFTMNQFDIGSISSMYISSVGYDEGSSAYNLLNLNSPNEARLSFITVYGPIASLFNTNWGINARFKFQYSKNTKFNYQLAPGASFALVSPGYLSKDSSYRIPYKVDDALDRSYDFGGYNWVQSWYNVADFQNQENIQFTIQSDNQAVSPITLNQYGSNYMAQYANKVTMKVQSPNGDHAPRFLFQVASGSAFSFSLIGVILVSLFKNFY